MNEWTTFEEAMPKASGWRWILYWTDAGQPQLLRYVNGDTTPSYATHWQFVDGPYDRRDDIERSPK